jgi:hypothetical protein
MLRSLLSKRLQIGKRSDLEVLGSNWIRRRLQHDELLRAADVREAEVLLVHARDGGHQPLGPLRDAGLQLGDNLVDTPGEMFEILILRLQILERMRIYDHMQALDSMQIN